MKRLIAALAFLPAVAFAEPQLLMTAPSSTGGIISVYAHVNRCYSGLGVYLAPPFAEGVPGCVTVLKKDSKTFHVVYSNGAEADYDYNGWTPAKPAKPVKGAL